MKTASGRLDGCGMETMIMTWSYFECLAADGFPRSFFTFVSSSISITYGSSTAVFCLQYLSLYLILEV